jgi:hypothetical protein
MSETIALVHLRAPQADRPRIASVLREAGTVGEVLPGSWNGGDLLWRGRQPPADGADALLADPGVVRHVDRACFDGVRSGGDWSGSGVYRVLLMSVKPAATPAQIERFECDLLAMPRYIASIRAWRLGRVREAAGARRWTHVWEQEYADVAGLSGPYMLHPYHWAVVDRWFDPESTDWIVDPWLCHSFCDQRASHPPSAATTAPLT